MAPAIRVEGVSKKYRLTRSGEGNVPYRTLRDDLVRWASYPVRWARGEVARTEDFWALKDVSFDVQPGEVVGVIGRNGAGKSTLLKILSRITKPTDGRVRLRGRVGSLLEVGTGFHPELTGRENIYLSGAVLGMSRAEIRRKFDEIVAFAEVEKFLDLAVKRYSSGMYMRLAFAVAAHLEPEILLVDEVLAVGDAAFQRKCLGKMGEVARAGRTVLFVSHNMAAVRLLCPLVIWIAHGGLAGYGATTECIRRYLAQNEGGRLIYRPPAGTGGRTCRVSEVRVTTGTAETDEVCIGDRLRVEAVCLYDPPTTTPRIGFVLATDDGQRVLNANNTYQTGLERCDPVGDCRLVCDLGAVPLLPGTYRLSVWIGDASEDQVVLPDCVCFEVGHRDVWGTGRLPPTDAGPLAWPTAFTLEPVRNKG
jgi:lipopolysaccharide transport system ATP-binding protein